MISSVGRSAMDLSIGMFCHEAGHMLCRFPDLYDYGRRDNDFTSSVGLGTYCLMSAGNHLNHGRTPAPVCSYLRDLVDWPDRVVYLNEQDGYDVSHDDYGTLFKYRCEAPNEYFLVENRSKIGLDAYLPSDGLAVFHCDTLGSNEWQQGTAARHYQCALLQAGGRRDLENDRRCDAADLFADVEGVALSEQTLPSSREWDGSESGFILRDISGAGRNMQFRTGQGQVRPPQGSAVGESFPDLLIPDHTPEGKRDSIHLSGEGGIRAIRVSVDILHTYQGDLSLDLYSPQGTAIVLFAQHSNPGHDLVQTFDSSEHEELAGLVGEPFAGEWILHVKDLLAEDTGRLHYWKIEIDYESAEQTIEMESVPDLAIPDNDPVGKTDLIHVDERGRLKDIEVSLNISHTFIRDLRVELVAPSGHSIFLHDCEGGAADNIRRSYDPSTLASMDALRDLPIQGDWSLRIKDLEGMDTGTLNRWSLRLQYSRC